jgi:monovalent cation/proton antiporter MnhG/PhaG subunit
VRAAAVTVLLTFGIGVELLCGVGMWVMKDVFDRLHYLGPASSLGPLAIGAAVLVQEGLGQPTIKSALVVLLTLVTSPVLSHATGRAARVRQFDHWVPLEGEMVEG